MRQKINLLAVALGVPLSFLLTNHAFADECGSVGTDSQWNESMHLLADMVGNKQYDEARELSKAMSNRCSRSPMLNYIQGKLLEAEGDRDQALFSYQKASEYTYEFAVTPNIAKRIWYARYEFEYPDRTEAGLQKLVEEKLALQAQQSEAQNDLAMNREKYALRENTAREVLKNDYSIGLWTGTGLGIAGLALTAAGIGLLATMNDEDKYGKREPGKSYPLSGKYITSWALLGGGITATLSGAILAGIFGYKYPHIDIGETSTLSFQISPTNAGFTLAF